MLEPSNPIPSMKRSSPSSLTGMLKCCDWPGRSTKRRSTIRTPASRASDMTSATVVVGVATPLGIRSRVVIAMVVLRPLCASRTKQRACTSGGHGIRQTGLRFSTGAGASSCAFCMTLTASISATRSSGSARSQSPRASSRWTRYAMVLRWTPRRAAASARLGDDSTAASVSMRSRWASSRPTRIGARSSRAWRMPSGRLRTLPSRR